MVSESDFIGERCACVLKARNREGPLQSVEKQNNNREGRLKPATKTTGGGEVYCNNQYIVQHVLLTRVVYVVTSTITSTMLPVSEGYWRYLQHVRPSSAIVYVRAADLYNRQIVTHYIRLYVLLCISTTLVLLEIVKLGAHIQRRVQYLLLLRADKVSLLLDRNRSLILEGYCPRTVVRATLHYVTLCFPAGTRCRPQ